MARSILTLALLLWAAVAGAASPERVLAFHSHIEVRADGSLLVTETIRVVAAGKNIRRGIYRDFPTRYNGAFGRKTVPFEVLRILRDGANEPYHLEDRQNGTRIYIGRRNRELPPGEYEYEIAYRTAWQLGHFAGYDELYWNVTGNGWTFPIEGATATVRLPRALPPDALRLEGYTGAEGAKGGAYRAAVDSRGAATFQTTAPLATGEGLTIVTQFPKGLVAEPSRADRLRRWSHDNPEWRPMAVGLAILLAYYLFVWSRVGRDPVGSTIIPRFEPPANVSAADARYLAQMKFEERGFAAALLNAAVKGHLRLEEAGGRDITVVATPELAREPLSNDEKALLDALNLEAGASLALRAENRTHVSRARDALKSELKKEHLKRHFVTNSAYTIPGLLLTLAVLGAMTFAMPHSHQVAAIFIAAWLTGWTFGVGVLLATVGRLWREVARGKPVMAIPAVLLTGFSLPFLAGEIFGIGLLLEAGSVLLAVALLALAGTNYSFYHLLKAPTRIGRRLYDQLEGFKMYLGVAEKNRLRMLSGPTRDPQLFEKYLPYALALGVENEWAEQFSDVLERARGPDGEPYRPSWYSGRSWHASSPAAFASSLSGTIAAAATPPGSSSGGGGGGSSGGGGGGGGGGGW